MKKPSSTESKTMEDKFIKPKLSRMSQLQTNSDKLPELKDKCFMDPTEFFLVD